jgi:hypothetical protein
MVERRALENFRQRAREAGFTVENTIRDLARCALESPENAPYSAGTVKNLATTTRPKSAIELTIISNRLLHNRCA